MTHPLTPPVAKARRAKLPAQQTVDLALQGGGSHGAFTWGVLDRLLEEEDILLSGVSGTSAGAMNAVALAAGLMAGGREGARVALRKLWEQVARMGPWKSLDSPPAEGGGPAWPTSPWLPAGQSWLDAWAGPAGTWARDAQSWWSQTLGRTLSPYQLNPLNLNPLREMLESTIDFERVRHCDRTQLFIAATHVQTGHLRIFRQHELSVDVVMASACLPLLFQAVEIEGQAYWDGGFAGNPSLLPLITETPADDLLLVQINPRLRTQLPTSAADILDRMNEITFNASLLKELRTLALLRELMSQDVPAGSTSGALFRRVQALRVHRIAGGQALAQLGSGSKMDTRWSLINRLHGLGREAATQWLNQHRGALGRRSTVDLDQEFSD